MKYIKSKYKFTYGPKTLDLVVLTTLVVILWVGTFLGWGEHGFSGDIYSKWLTSFALLYLIWLFVVSRKPQVIEFDETGITIPNTWLPGYLKRKVIWSEIIDVDVSRKNHLVAICLYLSDNRRHYLYIKAINASYNKRVIKSPDEKLFLYLYDVLEYG